MKQLTWVRRDVVLAIHRRQIAEHGGLHGIRDEGLLDSALARPRNLAAYADEPSLAELAAAYAYGLAANHPFADGNKRTAFVICRLFLELNGQSLRASPEEKYLTFLALAAGEISEEQLGRWLSERLVAVTP